MKQSTSTLSAFFDDDEIEVSDILLNLKSLFQQSESRSCLPQFTWGSRKRRSNRDLGLYCHDNSPLLSPCSVRTNSPQVQEGCRFEPEPEPEPIKFKTHATSPDTPLCFSPSDCDDKPQILSKKNCKRKTTEELMGTIDKLTRQRELLRGEVENVRRYHNQQKAYNLKLKAMKEGVMTTLKGQEVGINSGQHFGISTIQSNCQHPFSMDQKAKIWHGQYPVGQFPQGQLLFSSANGLGYVNCMGSPLLFDYSSDFAKRKAQYAEARRRRKMKRIEIKKSRELPV